MTNELITGIDLGLSNPHRACIVDSDSRKTIGKSFNFDRSKSGFDKLIKQCEKVKENRQLIFVMEPTSMAWLPLCCFLIAKGFIVYVVKTQMVGALRKVFGLNKSDHLDAETLARIYLIRPDSLKPVYIPTAKTKAVDRLCRQRARYVKRATSIKDRLWHIFTFANPKAIDAFNGNIFSKFGRAFIRNFINPFKVVETGTDKLAPFLAKHAHGQVSLDEIEKLYQTSLSTVQIYQEYSDKYGLPFDVEALQIEVNNELDTLKHIEEKIKALDKEIEKRYRIVDPQKHLQSLRGIANVLAPIIFAAIGDIRRFPNIRAFKCFLGLIPRKKQSTDKDIKGLPITKTSFWLLKHSFYMAAEVARHWDPEIAEFYHRLMKRGKHHDQAVCACASKLAGRVYAVMKRMADPNCAEINVPYVLRDLEHRPVDKRTAKEIIDYHFGNGNNGSQAQSELINQQDFELRKLLTKKLKYKGGSNDVKSIGEIFQSMLKAAMENEKTKK